MNINVEHMKKHGYHVDVHMGDNGHVESVTIEGTVTDQRHEAIEAWTSALKADFPGLDHDTVVGIAYRAWNTAQSHDIVRVCAMGR